MMQYTAQRLGDELHAIGERLPVDIGVVGAARRATQAAALLLDMTTIDNPDDPRKVAIFTYLTHAGTLLTEAADQIASLSTTISDLAALLIRPGSGIAQSFVPDARQP